MKAKIWPWESGDHGYVCMPLKRNIPEPNANGKHEDWKLVNCPACGEECWESDVARRLVKARGVDALCTKCALRASLRRGDAPEE